MRTKKIKYEIFSGAGNDFVMINNYDNVTLFDKQQEFTARVCDKYFKEIDGVIFLERTGKKDASIRMNYYNRDGSYGAMCGNGARCIAKFAFEKGLIKDKIFNLEAVGRIYKAEILNSNVRISFPPPLSLKTGLKTSIDLGKGMVTVNTNWINLGSEHLVIFISQNKGVFEIKSLDKAKINEWGKVLRFHNDFQPSGANVNFVELLNGNEIKVRTYERGVERETLACGTGVISSAVISNLLFNIQPPVKVLTQSREWLTVNFKNNDGAIESITLEGSARKISEGEISFDPETYRMPA
jgi:diaminopimelate epimerase